jgi:cardiolipin synthase
VLDQISARVTGKPLLGGNRIDPLWNGEQAYPAMLEAIAGAQRSVCLCTYIFDTDDTGREFVDALGAAAARGATVRVIVDAIGEQYSRPHVSRLLRRHPGVQVARFLPRGLRSRLIGMNLRNHRKILVTDGTVGFTGGMNLGRRHLASAPGSGRRTAADVHFRVAGPAVLALEEVFFEDWLFCTGQAPARDELVFPLSTGAALCRGIPDGPNEDLDKLQWILVGALGCARRRVQIMTPYFIPSRELMAGLNAAALRGVEVDIILPRVNNLPFVAWACQAMLPEVLRYGVKVWYQPPPFAHHKLMVVDQLYVILGSANLDPRSLRLNFEFNLEVYDLDLAGRLSADIDAARARSAPVTLDELRRRSLPVALRDGIARLFSPYL